MGLFSKKIKCSYCNKSVDESYAIDVGICPHCSKRLILNHNPNDCFHSDGTSHSINNYTTTNSNYNNNAYSPADTTNSNYNSVENETNAYSRSQNEANTYGRTQSETGTYSKPNTYNRPQNTTNTTSGSASPIRRNRPTIDPSYIKKVNQEANLENSHGSFESSPTSLIKKATKSQKKIVSIVIAIFFATNLILPIAATLISVLFFNESYDEPIEETYGEEYYSEKDYYTDSDSYYEETYAYDEDGTRYRFPSSSVLTTYLPEYFDKSLSDINYDDLSSIKGISFLCDFDNNIYTIYLYDENDQGYKTCIKNNMIDTDKVINLSRGNIISLDIDDFYHQGDAVFCDLQCFPNLEYIYTDYDNIYEGRLSNLDNLECIIAPNTSLGEQNLSEPDKLKHLSINTIPDSFDVGSLTQLTSLNVGFYCDGIETLINSNPNIKALILGLYVDTDIINKLDNLEYLGLTEISDLENFTHASSIKGLILDYTDLDSISSISQFTNLEELTIINDHTLVDYSPIGNLKKLNSLTLHIPESIENEILPKSSNLSTISHLNIQYVYDEEFFDYLDNVRNLELSYYTTDETYHILLKLDKTESILIDHTYVSGRVIDLSILGSREHLSDVKIIDSYMQFDLTGIFFTSNIKNLVIDNCEFYVDGSRFRDNTSIENITITNSYFIDSYYNSDYKLVGVDCSIADLAYYMNKFINLKSLDMRGCDLSTKPNTNTSNVLY